MIYRRIRASWKNRSDILQRVFLLDESMSVLEFTIVLQKLFHMDFSHLFQIMFSKQFYMPAKFNDTSMNCIEQLSWQDLPQKFSFEYDFGDSWEFDIFLYKKMVSKEDPRRVIIEGGSGAGIWEDARHAFEHYLAYGRLPDNELYEDFFPDNLQLPDSIEESLHFDMNAEQELIDAFMSKQFDNLINEMKVIRTSADEWDVYNEAVDAMYTDRLIRGAEPLNAAQNAMEAFLSALDLMVQENTLPSKAHELAYIDNGPEDYEAVYGDVPDCLYQNGRYDYCLESMKKIRHYFPDDMEVKQNTDGVILSCLCGLNRFEQAHALLDEWDQILDDPASKSLNRARVYIAEGRYEEAERLLKPYVSIDTEAIPENYPYLIAAYQLYSITDPKRAEIFADKLDIVERELFPDEHEAMFTEANEELCFAAQRFREHQSQYRYSIGAAVFIMLCQDNGNVILPLGTDMNPLVHTTDDGRAYAVVCSCPEAADELGYYDEGPMAVRDIVKSVSESGLDGILVDPDEYGNGLFIHAQTLEDLEKVLNEEEGNDLPLFLS